MTTNPDGSGDIAPNAPIQADESVNGIMARIEEQTLELTGRFVDYAGQALPW